MAVQVGNDIIEVQDDLKGTNIRKLTNIGLTCVSLCDKEEKTLGTGYKFYTRKFVIDDKIV